MQTDVCERAPAAVPLALADRPAEARAYTQVRLCHAAETRAERQHKSRQADGRVVVCRR
eukprot:COSAG04_NODE_23797_length_332_cov_0.660944_1_plen_58_part_10